MNTLWYDAQTFGWVPLVFAASLTAALGGAFLYWLILTVWGWLTAEPLTLHSERERFRHEREIHEAVSPHAAGLSSDRKRLDRVTKLGGRG